MAIFYAANVDQAWTGKGFGAAFRLAKRGFARSVSLAGLLLGSGADAAPESNAETPVATTSEVISSEKNTPQNEMFETFKFYERQIRGGEASEAQTELNQLIGKIEVSKHRYHEDLLVPITLRGDALVAQGRPAEALEDYGRARHIARVSKGLFHPSQVPVIYREANLLKQIGDMQTAFKREEYAYEVVHRSHDEYASELLPAISRLADFFMQSNNPLAARTLLNRAQLIHEYNKTLNSVEAVGILRAIARSHRLERFPTAYTNLGNDEENDKSYITSLRNSDLDGQLRFINSFPAGEKALQRVVGIQKNRFGEDSDEAIAALLELADWHLMFNRSHAALTLYQYIYFAMDGIDADIDVDADIDADIDAHIEKVSDQNSNERIDDDGAEFEHSSSKGDEFFARPVMLYFPKPPDLKPPAVSKRGVQSKGHVALEFAVSPTGKVRSLKTREVSGPKSMNYRVRRSMRVAIFRPQLVDGVLVGSEAQSFTYEFPYFEKLAVQKPASEDLGGS